MDLNWILGGGLYSNWSGDGSWYWIQRSLILMIHDPLLYLEVVSWYSEILCSTESWSWHIMLNNKSWRRWSSAEAGKCPPRKWMTQAGVFGASFCKLLSVSLTCFSINSNSLFFKTRAAVPDRSTGRQYIWWALIVAAGFALWALASPTGSIDHNWFLWAENLAWRWARFPCTDLVTPTWSASSTKSILLPSIWIGWGVLEQ